MKTVSFAALRETLDFDNDDVIGVHPEFVGPPIALSSATTSSTALSFCRDSQQSMESLVSSEARVVLVPRSATDQWKRNDQALVRVDNPRLAFAYALSLFAEDRPDPGIESSAHVHPTSTISPSAHLGHNVVVGPQCSVGDNVILHPGVVLVRDVRIEESTIIGPGTVIGTEGFGYERNEDGLPVRLHHVGGVAIGARVEVGANTCIDRGTIESTLIQDDVKIDNLVHIAHNAQIERGALVIANAMVGGSVRIGVRAWIAPSSTIINGVAVGRDATVGLAAVVLRDVPDQSTVVGNPARTLESRK